MLTNSLKSLTIENGLNHQTTSGKSGEIGKTGKLENWKTGKLENWKIGKLENWKTSKKNTPEYDLYHHIQTRTHLMF